MKAKNILMSVLLAMGFIAAKAATGYPPELALVSQPVMVYNYNSITVYYDLQNIGDYTYRGHIFLYLEPDNGYPYADKYVRVRPGHIKRVAINIPSYRANPSWYYTIKPYYELGEELYSFTTFEYFEPLGFLWNGPRTDHWIVVNVPPRMRYYHRPGSYRFYYDGFRPAMYSPYAVGYGPATPPPPLNPMHHTYSYHYSNGGYPTNHFNENHTSPTPNDNANTVNNGNTGGATVRPKTNGNSMSHGNSSLNNNGNNSMSGSSNNGGSNSGRTGTGRVSRPNGNTGNNSGTSTNNSLSNSGRVGNSSVSRSNGNSNSSNRTVSNGTSSSRTGNGNGSNVSRPNSNSRVGGTPSNSRNGSASTRSASNSSSSRKGTTNSTNSTRNGNSSRSRR